MNHDLEVTLIKSIAKSISGPWDKITFNIEIGVVKGSITVSDDGDAWLKDKAEQIFLDYGSSTAFRELHKANETAPNGNWSICDITIKSDGNYNIDYSYETPKRITALNNGELI